MDTENKKRTRQVEKIEQGTVFLGTIRKSFESLNFESLKNPEYSKTLIEDTKKQIKLFNDLGNTDGARDLELGLNSINIWLFENTNK